MPTHKDDLIELARICLSHARSAHDFEASTALFRLALDYSRRVTELDSAENHGHLQALDNQRAHHPGIGGCTR